MRSTLSSSMSATSSTAARSLRRPVVVAAPLCRARCAAPAAMFARAVSIESQSRRISINGNRLRIVSASATAATLAPPGKTPPMPFVRLAGQEEMKLALLLNVIDPGIGGVLIMGDRGTGKSVAVSAQLEKRKR